MKDTKVTSMSQLSQKSSNRPKVSVVSISYNQEEYITEALESFVMQKTNFDFEVIIADDHSSDSTPKIIADYAKRYPHIIKPILRRENTGIQKNITDTLRHAKGEYIALCEGDDFWTDPAKLQRQANFLDSHPDYTIVFHPVRVFYESFKDDDVIFPEVRDTRQFTIRKLLERNFVQTNSVMYRKKIYDKMPLNILPLDWYLHLFHAKGGKIGFIDKVMSAYRRHPGGVWWESSSNTDELYKKHGMSHAALYDELIKLYNDDASVEVMSHNIANLMESLSQVDERQGTQLLLEVITKYPRFSIFYITALKDRINKSNEDLRDLNNVYRSDLTRLNQDIDAKVKEIQAIEGSRVWRAKTRISKLLRRE